MSKIFRTIRTATCVLAIIIATPALAGSAAESISANEPLIRMVPPGMTISSAYMTLRNADNKDHKLVKVASTSAQTVELHTHINEGGMMEMRQIKSIEVRAKGEAVLKSGGMHMMLIGLKQELKEGDNIPLTLTFEDGSSKTVEVPVRNLQTEMEMKHGHEGMNP